MRRATTPSSHRRGKQDVAAFFKAYSFFPFPSLPFFPPTRRLSTRRFSRFFSLFSRLSRIFVLLMSARPPWLFVASSNAARHRCPPVYPCIAFFPSYSAFSLFFICSSEPIPSLSILPIFIFPFPVHPLPLSASLPVPSPGFSDSRCNPSTTDVCSMDRPFSPFCFYRLLR